ncbi:hypothetical protein [Streptomyces chryseus]|uniref:hypothetical protein n=1 Tax=Streptomyces chryseus TaxID=68186 RepID=UPI00110FA067|nr:hypothetical protein [Streptomyces chryseus]
MTDIDRRRRHRRLLLVLAFIATVGGVVLLTALDQLGKDRAALVAAFLSVVAAAAAWEATGRASDTAEQARKAAEVVARIERDRWLAELSPQFEFTLTKEGDQAARLLVHLAGPDALGHLDSVTVRIGDDDYDHTPTQQRLGFTDPLGPTPEQIAAHIWGPFRLRPRVNEADDNGRELTFTDLQVGRGRPLALDRTYPGSWMGGKTYDMWQREYEGHPLRLVFTCRRGEETWKVARTVDNPDWRPAEPQQPSP